MAGVGWGKALTHEDVAQVATAVDALHLYPHTVGVGKMLHGSGYFLVEGWPATVRVELIVGVI